MPSEKREIIFRNDKVLAAIRQLHQRANQAFPDGTVENITVRAEGGGHFDCDVVSNKGFRERVIVGGEKLAAALILFCISRRIAIPAAAQKRLSVIDGQLALSVILPDSGGMINLDQYSEPGK